MDYSEEEKREYQTVRAERRQLATDEFPEAAKLANRHGLVLTRCTEAHYQLRVFDDGKIAWLYNIYPGKRRIWSDRTHRGPFLKVPMFWTLTDLIMAVADRVKERRI
jgi:hypothetical protein